ncbi:prepilin-type N-terminal cleavage/methylation domain-containing protein [Elusimicrobium posterum]|uniref:type IV pilin protein n=1 Tax=Elusimicrobium posterum TaxID=3116653 RepID=UPI003C77DFCD
MYKKNKLNPRKGFTLIELLVVVLIIGILAAIALPSYKKAVERAMLAEITTNIGTIHRAQQKYFLENGEYPASFNDFDFELPGTNVDGRHPTLTGNKIKYSMNSGPVVANQSTAGCIWGQPIKWNGQKYALGRGPDGEELCVAAQPQSGTTEGNAANIKSCQGLGYTVESPLKWPQCWGGNYVASGIVYGK